MEKITIKDLSVLTTMLKHLKYGSVLITYEDESIGDYLKKYMELVSIVKGSDGFLTMTEAIESVLEEGEYKDVSLPGWYRLTWADRHEDTPVFTEDDLRLKELAQKASKEGSMFNLNVSSGLINHAKKIAKEHDIKFMSSGFGVAFNGKKKASSAYKQLEAAIIQEAETVEFDSSDVNPQTIRVYVSQISGFTGRKMKVSVKGDKIIVFLKEPGPKELFSEDIKALIDKYSATLTPYEMFDVMKDKLGISDYRSFVNDRAEGLGISFNIPVAELTAPMPVEPPVWEQMGFNSEKEHNDYEAKKQADLAEWTNPALEYYDGISLTATEEEYIETTTTTDHLKTETSEEANNHNGSPED